MDDYFSDAAAAMGERLQASFADARTKCIDVLRAGLPADQVAECEKVIDAALSEFMAEWSASTSGTFAALQEVVDAINRSARSQRQADLSRRIGPSEN